MDTFRAEQFEISNKYIWRLVMEKNIKIFDIKRLRIKKV